jgi:CHRD domain-containing protein/MacB-like protein/FtsX-like permease family protein
MLKHRSGFVVSLCILFLLTLSYSIYAEALRTAVRMTPEAVVPPPVTPPTGLSVNIAVTVDVNRDASGNLMPSAPYFFIFLNNLENVEVTGVYLREGAANTNGPIVLDLGLTNSTYPPGRGTIVLGGRNIDLELLQGLLENPNGFYFEFRTNANPYGALRGQLQKFTESLGNTVALSPINEVPPVTEVTASGIATVTIDPTRNSTGEIMGGKVTFSVLYDLPANSEIIGLNIYKQIAGMNGDPVISSGISGSNSIITPTGKGKLSLSVRVKHSEIKSLRQLIENPTGFYVNLQTKTHESGLIRGQLTSIAEAPVIHLSGPTTLATGGTTPVRVDLIVSEWDLGNFDDSDRTNGVLINGKPTDYIGRGDGLPPNWDAIVVEDQPRLPGQSPPMRRFKAISPGFLEAMGTRLITGRSYEWVDLLDRRPVILISENLAREYWGDPRTALGKRIGYARNFREVIGVVQDVYDNGVQDAAPATVYWPTFDANKFMPATRYVTFALRSARTGSEGFLRQVEQAVWSVNANLSVAAVQSMAELHVRSMARTSFTLVMLAIAGGMALLLGIIGIYGVIAYTVAQRRREVGIRLALGAEPSTVRRMFCGTA